jgi:hypothetical protein
MAPILSIPPNPAKAPLVSDRRSGAKTFLRLLREVAEYSLKHQVKIREALPVAARSVFDQWIAFIPIVVTLLSLVDLLFP